MSVLIRGMEIPKQCGGCPLRGVCKQRIYIEYRPKNCPLVEIPTTHGRLIDADEMIRIWDGATFKGSIRPLIDARPTVIEAEGSEG